MYCQQHSGDLVLLPGISPGDKQIQDSCALSPKGPSRAGLRQPQQHRVQIGGAANGHSLSGASAPHVTRNPCTTFCWEAPRRQRCSFPINPAEIELGVQIILGKIKTLFLAYLSQLTKISSFVSPGAYQRIQCRIACLRDQWRKVHYKKRALPSGPNYQPKAPPLNTITLEIDFNL